VVDKVGSEWATERHEVAGGCLQAWLDGPAQGRAKIWVLGDRSCREKKHCRMRQAFRLQRL